MKVSLSKPHAHTCTDMRRQRSVLMLLLAAHVEAALLDSIQLTVTAQHD